MASFQHPASLNALQQYSQACSILRHTTRASNPAWYQDALELNFQLHVRIDGQTITSTYLDRVNGLWLAGPDLTESILAEPAQIEVFISEVLRDCHSHGATAIGVIVYIADEFATAELKPDLDNPAALPEIRHTAYRDPAAILGDSSIFAEKCSWRVLPYAAAGGDVIGTTITISRQYSHLFNALRLASERENFPIITHALSAPLVALMGLDVWIRPTPGKPFVAILQYPWLTLLAFFNEHSDLRLIRTLQHRGVLRPLNFRNALITTNASLEFVDPDLFLIPLGESIDANLDAELRLTFTNSRVEVVRTPTVDGLAEWSPEPAFAALEPIRSAEPATESSSHTFSTLREDRWALQDFLPVPRDIMEIYPTRSEMRLLRALRLARVAMVAIAILSLSYTAFGVIDLIRRPEWAFQTSQAEAVQGILGKLTVERQKLDHWNNLLEDRSKAWVVMESLARMFPANSGMLVKNYNHAAKPDSTPGQAKLGFVKEWKITGYARDEALDYLNTINTREGISAHFSDIAKVTGNKAFDPNIGNRSLVVNVRTQENTAFKAVPPEEFSDADETTYPFTFDLTITQRFEATDPLAIIVSKAP